MSNRRFDRREFLRLAGLTAAATTLGPHLGSLYGGSTAEAQAMRGLPGGSMLDLPAAEAPVDRVVVLMMENRSFDHFLGWLATDDAFIENGKRLYGGHFYVEGDQSQSFRDPDGRKTATYYLPDKDEEENAYRGCGHPDPGHGWQSGRAQRDGGFLAEGSDNDEFALGFYRDGDMPLYATMARRFTSFDRYHCSVLGPTFPNREYLHAGQSGGHKSNDIPFDTLGFQWPAIWDRLAEAGVPAAYYFVDLPTIALWGPRMIPYARHIEAYFADCAAGTLPNVTFVDPGFTTGLRTDDHPYADMRAGQRYVFNLIQAFTRSPLWERGAFFITYDEWGGFFDHVRPPVLPDDRSSTNDLENFGQAGFRVPTLMASPFARPGYVDHRLYDHTSILRFIEWRFLGAPPEGPEGNGWWLTKRDRNALNIGRSLKPDRPDPAFEMDALPQIPITSAPCQGEELEGLPVPDVPPSNFEEALNAGFFQRVGYDIDLRPLPV